MGILNDQFKSMTPAQKTYVLSMLINKIYKNPTDYKLNKDGILLVGDKLNFSKLFENGEEIKSIFAKAKETIIEGSSQEKLILENEKKISDWVENNPGVKITSDKVAEILATKPKVEIMLEPPVVPDSMLISEVLIPKPKTDLQQQIESEITDAKQKLEVLEGGKNRGGMRSMMGDISSVQSVESAVRNGINDIYGESGFMGFGKVIGVNSKGWGEMARLPANKVIEYYTGDSTKSGLVTDIVEKLLKSKKHNAFMNQMAGLMEQSDGAVKPFENENIEQFARRLVGYSLRTQTKLS